MHEPAAAVATVSVTSGCGPTQKSLLVVLLPLGV